MQILLADFLLARSAKPISQDIWDDLEFQMGVQGFLSGGVRIGPWERETQRDAALRGWEYNIVAEYYVPWMPWRARLKRLWFLVRLVLRGQ